MSRNDQHQGDYTSFDGYFQVDRPLDSETAEILTSLKYKMCRARDVNKLSDLLNISVLECKRKYGRQGQYYLGDDKTTLLPANKVYWPNNHFEGQPRYGRQGWEYHPSDCTIRFDGMEKFHCYSEWITLVVQDVLAPRGYIVNGTVRYENRADRADGYDSELDQYFEVEKGEPFDETTRDEEEDVWGTIEIYNNVVRADHPVWRG